MLDLFYSGLGSLTNSSWWSILLCKILLESEMYF